MKGPNHILCTAAAVGAAGGPPSMILAAAIASTLPDLLERTVPFLPHRGPSHWVILWLFPLFALIGAPHAPSPWVLGIALGAWFHLLEDACSSRGIPLGPFLPQVRIPFYETGTIKEGLFVIAWLALCLSWLIFKNVR